MATFGGWEKTKAKGEQRVAQLDISPLCVIVWYVLVTIKSKPGLSWKPPPDHPYVFSGHNINVLLPYINCFVPFCYTDNLSV